MQLVAATAVLGILPMSCVVVLQLWQVGGVEMEMLQAEVVVAGAGVSRTKIVEDVTGITRVQVTPTTTAIDVPDRVRMVPETLPTVTPVPIGTGAEDVSDVAQLPVTGPPTMMFATSVAVTMTVLVVAPTPEMEDVAYVTLVPGVMQRPETRAPTEMPEVDVTVTV
jgi:hypothetical protein